MKDSMKRLFFILLVTTALASCDNGVLNEKDGDWDPMQWKANTYQLTTDSETGGKAYSVPAEGCTFVFHCRNYKGIWMSTHRFEHNGEVWYSYEDKHRNGSHGDDHHGENLGDDDEYCHYRGEWCDIQAQGDSLCVCFSANGEYVRKTSVCVTAGDIFDTFQFIQTASQK